MFTIPVKSPDSVCEDMVQLHGIFNMNSPLSCLAQDMDVNFSISHTSKTPKRSLLQDLCSAQDTPEQKVDTFIPIDAKFKIPLAKSFIEKIATAGSDDNPLNSAKPAFGATPLPYRNQNKLFQSRGIAHWNQKKLVRSNTESDFTGKKRSLDETRSPGMESPCSGRLVKKPSLNNLKIRRAATVLDVKEFKQHEPLLKSVLESKDMIRRVTAETLVELLENGLENVKVHLIDARFGYEFNGGHIKSAENITNVLDLDNRFFKQEPTEKHIIIFHCEYSIQRAPQMALHFRKLDRNANAMRYPNLYYPDVYILKGGYREFYEKFKALRDNFRSCVTVVTLK